MARLGGGYKHAGELAPQQRHLVEWEGEDWQTATGEARARHGEVTERYLPREAWEQLSPEEREATMEAKRRGSQAGRQTLPNTAAAKLARKAVDLDDLTVPEARERVRGWTADELRAALAHEREHRGRRTLVEHLERRVAGAGG